MVPKISSHMHAVDHATSEATKSIQLTTLLMCPLLNPQANGSRLHLITHHLDRGDYESNLYEMERLILFSQSRVL